VSPRPGAVVRYFSRGRTVGFSVRFLTESASHTHPSIHPFVSFHPISASLGLDPFVAHLLRRHPRWAGGPDRPRKGTGSVRLLVTPQRGGGSCGSPSSASASTQCRRDDPDDDHDDDDPLPAAPAGCGEIVSACTRDFARLPGRGRRPGRLGKSVYREQRSKRLNLCIVLVSYVCLLNNEVVASVVVRHLLDSAGQQFLSFLRRSVFRGGRKAERVPGGFRSSVEPNRRRHSRSRMDCTVQ
jgi:hypothetical protein